MNRNIVLLFSLFFILCVILPNVYAVDVIYVSANGNDAGDGSSSNPFYNITTAMDNVNEKNIIVLKNGSYQSNININKSVTIIGQDNAVLDGNYQNWYSI